MLWLWRQLIHTCHCLDLGLCHENHSNIVTASASLSVGLLPSSYLTPCLCIAPVSGGTACLACILNGIHQALSHIHCCLPPHDCGLQALWLEEQQAATIQAQIPPGLLAPAMALLAVAATQAQAQKVPLPLQPKPKATSPALPRTRPPRAAAMAARQTPQATIAAAAQQPQACQEQQGPLVQLALASVLARLTPLATNRHHSKAAPCTMPMVFQSMHMAVMVATLALLWVGQVPPLVPHQAMAVATTLAVATRATAVVTLAAAAALAVVG